MGVINIKPKDVVISFDLTILAGQKLTPKQLEEFNRKLREKQQEEKKR